MQPQRPEPSLREGSLVKRWGEHVVGLVRWFGFGRVLAVTAAVGGALVGGWWLLHASGKPIEAQLPRTGTSVVTTTVGSTVGDGASAAEGGAPASSGPETVVVHVAGAVVRPGVVRLRAGSRVQDAVAAVGGPVVGADVDALNLAALCVDGSRIYVPRLGETVDEVTSQGSAGGPALRVNINTASASDLDALPGIGPALAQAIVGYRAAHGPFRTLEALLGVPGVGPSKLEQLRNLVTV